MRKLLAFCGLFIAAIGFVWTAVAYAAPTAYLSHTVIGTTPTTMTIDNGAGPITLTIDPGLHLLLLPWVGELADVYDCQGDLDISDEPSSVAILRHGWIR